ncbi:armadillo repeat-containing protein 6 isoform X1 [Melanotaenia boesemani]|uniref:armadillo repeat-containing protein 6 isoform X1 n=1 Tax=Melanotaenia boesemani TaxID=1250792 RepID=UPI001C041CBA|nr:armadillo repeat-containing protein 6 isoform X1 [Melanotaenia boesemani]XP_041849582.1 armadillo repeat-containing protein 6 isoform X1 [Melanotaenia boesemani]XP_041849583.1 armadillo repeat-containing protein 6 isoform X1 [Melanotaenia boesemani]
MATRRVTQETFDAAVRENIEEFEMDPDEALRDAVEQFESQGVDLSCIVKAIPAVSSDNNQEEQTTHEVLQALDSLRIGKDSSCVTEVTAGIKCFTEQCSLGFAQRYLAAQKDAYPIILSYCKKSVEEQDALLLTLSALAALTDGQPDLLDAEGQQFILDVLKKYQADSSVTRVAICAMRHCCLKHEQNRQDLVKGGILPLLTGAVIQHSGCAELIKEASAALRVMTFDDDVRVTFGHAHEHAKMIVLEHNGLKVLIDAAKAHCGNTSVLSELCSTLSRLAVRNEFCQDICDLGGLKLMLTLLADSYESTVEYTKTRLLNQIQDWTCLFVLITESFVFLQELVRQVLSAIRAVAGNDDVKDAVVIAGGVQLIVIAMNRHMSNPTVCEQGCACLSVLALRKPNNCKVIMENGGALASLQAMKTHSDVVNVQKQACMLLRNLVARMRNFSQPILEMGAEALIAQAVQTHQDCGDVGKAALRDLGCKVELRELWTGKHGGLTN